MLSLKTPPSPSKLPFFSPKSPFLSSAQNPSIPSQNILFSFPCSSSKIPLSLRFFFPFSSLLRFSTGSHFSFLVISPSSFPHQSLLLFSKISQSLSLFLSLSPPMQSVDFSIFFLTFFFHATVWLPHLFICLFFHFLFFFLLLLVNKIRK